MVQVISPELRKIFADQAVLNIELVK